MKKSMNVSLHHHQNVMLTIFATLFVLFSVFGIRAYTIQTNAATTSGAEASADIYHLHCGKEGEFGGCYQKAIHCGGSAVGTVEYIKCSCEGTLLNEHDWLCSRGHLNNNSAPGGYYAYPHDGSCDEIVSTKLIFHCSDCGASLPSADSICNVLKGYELSCGYGEGETVGKLLFSIDHEDWTKSKHLQARLVMPESRSAEAILSIMDADHHTLISVNGDTLTYDTSNNGTYIAHFSGSENESTAEVQINIASIDTEAPIIQSVQIDTTNNSTAKVEVFAQDNASGIATDGYSWNADGNYQSQNTWEYTENGDYKIYVKDNAGNVTEQVFHVDQIIIPEPPKPTEPQQVPASAPVTETPSTQVSEVKESESLQVQQQQDISLMANEELPESQNSGQKRSEEKTPNNSNKKNEKKSSQQSTVTKSDNDESDNSGMIAYFSADEFKTWTAEHNTEATERNTETIINSESQRMVIAEEDTALSENAPILLEGKTEKSAETNNLVFILFIVSTVGSAGVMVAYIFMKKVGCLLHKDRKSDNITLE